MTSNTVHVQKERHSSSWLGNSVRWFVVHEPVNIHTLQSCITILSGKVSEAVCKCDWLNVRSYFFLMCEHFGLSVQRPSVICLRKSYPSVSSLCTVRTKSLKQTSSSPQSFENGIWTKPNPQWGFILHSLIISQGFKLVSRAAHGKFERWTKYFNSEKY